MSLKLQLISFIRCLFVKPLPLLPLLKLWADVKEAHTTTKTFRGNNEALEQKMCCRRNTEILLSWLSLTEPLKCDKLRK